MIARFPGTVPPGSECAAVCNLRDLGSTFCEIAGASKPAKSDSPSLWPFMKGKQPAGTEETDSELYQRTGPFGGKSDAVFKMVRRGPWKLWCYDIGGEKHFSLFNLKEDPRERKDLIGTPEVRETEASLKERLLADWDSSRITADARERNTDRVELDRSWRTYWLNAGYPVPADLDSDVETKYAKKLSD
jgi:arylsulfatase A-like enzyme